MKKKEWQFTLRLNTPAFVGGVQQGTKRVHFKKKNRDGVVEDKHEDVPFFPAEPGGMRVPSLRGVLGFWFRSTLGGLTSAEVSERQGRVLGSTVYGQGVAVRPCGSEFEGGELRYEGREEVFRRLYLGYGPLQLLKIADARSRSGMRDIATSFNSNACREAILVSPARPPIFHFAAQGTTEQIEGLVRCSRLLHAFGGIGARSRRGWGSVEVEGEGITPIPAHRDLGSYLREILAQLASSKDRPCFTAFSQQTRLFVTEAAATSEAILHEFALKLLGERSYRDGRPRAKADHDREFEDARRSPSEAITGIPTRLAFGLPFHPKHGWEIEYRGKKRGNRSDSKDDVTRRSSPLLLKVLRTADGQYVGVALLLKAQFFGDRDFEVGAKGKELTIPFGEKEYQVIDEFLDDSGWVEVRI